MAESTNQVVSELEQIREDEAQNKEEREDRGGDRGSRSDGRGDYRNDNRGDDRGQRAGRAVADLMPELGEDGESTERREVEGGRAYEVTYIVVANNPEAIESTRTGVRELIENAGGAVDNVRVSETRRLAFPMRKRADGVYVVVNARFKQEVVEELDRYFKLEESVLRHIVLREEQ